MCGHGICRELSAVLYVTCLRSLVGHIIWGGTLFTKRVGSRLSCYSSDWRTERFNLTNSQEVFVRLSVSSFICRRNVGKIQSSGGFWFDLTCNRMILLTFSSLYSVNTGCCARCESLC